MANLLEVRSVSMNFGGLAALKQVDFEVREGEIVGLIGPNGAGKTTMFNCLSGFLTPTSGDVLFRETSVVHLAPHQITALGMTRTFQTSRVFKRMTVMDHMLVGAHLHQRTGFWAATLRPGWVAARRRHARARGRKTLELFRRGSLAVSGRLRRHAVLRQQAAAGDRPCAGGGAQAPAARTSRRQA